MMMIYKIESWYTIIVVGHSALGSAFFFFFFGEGVCVF